MVRPAAVMWPPRHDSIPIAHHHPHPRGSVQRIFSVIRWRGVGKNEVICPYDGKDALCFWAQFFARFLDLAKPLIIPISTGFRTLRRDPKNSQGKVADLDGLDQGLPV